MRAKDYAGPGRMLRLIPDCQARVESGSLADLEALKSLLDAADVGMMTFGIARVAASAIISMGPVGVDELKAVLESGTSRQHSHAIIDSLWRAATREMLSAGTRSRPDSVGPFTIDEMTRKRAKAVLDDLIIQAGYDEELRKLFIDAVSWDDFAIWAEKDQGIPPTMHEGTSLGSYMFSVFRASSITLTEGLIDEF